MHTVRAQAVQTQTVRAQSVPVETVDGRIGVRMPDGGAVRTALIRRVGERMAPAVPVGTRDAGRLHMELDGAPVRLAPGRGRLSRRSYRVTAVRAGVTYTLRPKNSTTSSLVRDGVTLGELRRSGDDEVIVWWAPGADVDAADAALGCALAAAFGTGARFFLLALLEGLAQTPPG